MKPQTLAAVLLGAAMTLGGPAQADDVRDEALETFKPLPSTVPAWLVPTGRPTQGCMIIPTCAAFRAWLSWPLPMRRNAGICCTRDASTRALPVSVIPGAEGRGSRNERK